MDTLTHGLIAAVAARSFSKQDSHKPLWLAATLAAIFPDLDYFLFWLDPYRFITEWHRGLSHSLIMLPIWAFLISSVFYLILKRRLPLTKLFVYCSLGLLTHLAADLITVYGTQLFAPLNKHRFALRLTFDIDAWMGVLAFFSLVLSFIHRHYTRYGVLAIGVYLVFLIVCQQTAQSIAESRLPGTDRTARYYALPQPLLPYDWQLVIDRHGHYEIAYLSLSRTAWQYFSTWLTWEKPKTANETRVLQKHKKNAQYHFQQPDILAFKPQQALQWRNLEKLGGLQQSALVEEVWKSDVFTAFRRFASFPVLYRIDKDRQDECVWFTDLRYVYPVFKPPFRYGMCRNRAERLWRLFRLRRESINERQRLNIYPGFRQQTH